MFIKVTVGVHVFYYSINSSILTILIFIAIEFVHIAVSFNLPSLIISYFTHPSFILTTFPSYLSSHPSLLTAPHTLFSTAKYPFFVSFSITYLQSKIPNVPLTFILSKQSFHGINVQSCSLMMTVIFIVCSYAFVIVKVFAQVMKFFVIKQKVFVSHLRCLQQ